MGLRELLGLGEAPPTRLLHALERLAAAAERGAAGVYRSGAALGAPRPPAEAVFYTDEEELALEEARRLAYELSTGIRLGLNEDAPRPVDPHTGLPWGDLPPAVREAEGEAEEEGDLPGDGA